MQADLSAERTLHVAHNCFTAAVTHMQQRLDKHRSSVTKLLGCAGVLKSRA